jgi:hypothetical protein
LHGLAELGFLDGIRPRGPKDGEHLGRLLRIAALGVVGDLADKSHGEEVGQRRARKRGGPADAAALGGLKLGPGLDLGAIRFGKKLGAGEGDVFVAGVAAGNGLVAVENVDVSGAEDDGGQTEDHERDEHLEEAEAGAKSG